MSQLYDKNGNNSRILRWMLGLGLTATVAIGLVLLFLLTQATTNRNLYEQYYFGLFVVNVLVATLLLGVICWMAWRLGLRVYQHKFGSRLLVKLAAVFALAGFVPGMLIYVVSYQFVSRSIESWFDVKVEGALDAGLNLGRSTLEAISNDLANKTRTSAPQLSDTPDINAALQLDRIREALGADELTLWANNSRLIATVGQPNYQFSPELPSPQQFRVARSQGVISWVEGLDDAALGSLNNARIKVLAWVSSDRLDELSASRYLMITKNLPSTLVNNALAVTQANREYQERALARDGLRRMYIGTLTLSLFMAVFGSVLLAVVMGNKIIRPLLLLADGVREVAAGDLSPKASLRGKDELDGLTRSFADMTGQLAEARQAVQQSMEQVSAAHANLQTILDNLTAGVMVLNDQGAIETANPGVTRILRLPQIAHKGQHLEDIDGLGAFAHSVQQQFDTFLEHRGEHTQDHWQQSFELETAHVSAMYRSANDIITLVVRGAVLPSQQRLLVLDDISEIVSAQRTKAWGEVARRLAHEIKNPLTPIQLSAERLEMKLTGKIAEPEQAMLTKSVKTIVAQVDAMKRLVNEFRDYARLPTAELKPLDLNALVSELLGLYANEQFGVPVLADLDAACPIVHGDAQQLRQVIHNLLQNAQDATVSAHRNHQQHPVILKTQWLSSSHRVRLSVSDCGTGFPDNIQKRAFEPYVTTKDKGTGLGLALVKKIADEHHARVDISNRILDDQVMGAQISLLFPTDCAGTALPGSHLQT